MCGFISTRSNVHAHVYSTGYNKVNGASTSSVHIRHTPFARNQGFTLIELMIVITIAAILLAVAVPSFDNVLIRNRIDSIQSQLSSALALARSEAASRNKVISVCASDGAENCGASWSNGWVVFVDNNLNNVRDVGEEAIEVYSHPDAYQIAAKDGVGNAVNFISYGYQGFVRGLRGQVFTICNPGQDDNYARALMVRPSGAVSKSHDGSDTDSIHDNPLGPPGSNLSCT